MNYDLRDYFAAQAINALLNDDLPRKIEKQYGPDWVAVTAYKIADAMMKAREAQ